MIIKHRDVATFKVIQSTKETKVQDEIRSITIINILFKNFNILAATLNQRSALLKSIARNYLQRLISLKFPDGI